jgi:hypothetical protein
MNLKTYRLFIGFLFAASLLAQEIQPSTPESTIQPPTAIGSPKAIQLQGVEFVVPELIIGGEWTTTIRLTNRGKTAIPTTNVYFFDNTGIASRPSTALQCLSCRPPRVRPPANGMPGPS